MPITYNHHLPDSETFYTLFNTTGWNQANPISASELYSAISNSWYTYAAYDKDLMVGFGRVMSDGVYHALIVELIVLPSYQGQGIGSFVLTELVTQCKSSGIRQIQLFCAHGKTSFYLKHGFVARSEKAPGMELITTNHES